MNFLKHLQYFIDILFTFTSYVWLIATLTIRTSTIYFYLKKFLFWLVSQLSIIFLSSGFFQSRWNFQSPYANENCIRDFHTIELLTTHILFPCSVYPVTLWHTLRSLIFYLCEQSSLFLPENLHYLWNSKYHPDIGQFLLIFLWQHQDLFNLKINIFLQLEEILFQIMLFFPLSWNLLLYMPTIDMLGAHPHLFPWGSSNRETQEQKVKRSTFVSRQQYVQRSWGGKELWIIKEQKDPSDGSVEGEGYMKSERKVGPRRPQLIQFLSVKKSHWRVLMKAVTGHGLHFDVKSTFPVQ